MGQFLALVVTPADEQDREQVEALAAAAKEVTGDRVEVAHVDRSYTGRDGAGAAGSGIRQEVVELPDAEHGFVLLPRRRVGERSFVWLSRFGGLVKDYERLPETVAGLHQVAFSDLILARIIKLLMVGSA